LADAHAFGIVAVGAEGRGARGADPFLAALVAPLLLFHALAQKLKELVQPADCLDLSLFLLGQIFFGEFLEPRRRDLGGQRFTHQLEPLEHVAEHAVELVEVALVLHQRRAREIVEILDPTAGEISLHCFHQRQIFAQGDRNTRRFELVEEGNEHGARLRARTRRSSEDGTEDGTLRQPPGTESAARADLTARATPRAPTGDSRGERG
jgi:hypothetical protein